MLSTKTSKRPTPNTIHQEELFTSFFYSINKSLRFHIHSFSAMALVMLLSKTQVSQEFRVNLKNKTQI